MRRKKLRLDREERIKSKKNDLQRRQKGPESTKHLSEKETGKNMEGEAIRLKRGKKKKVGPKTL